MADPTKFESAPDTGEATDWDDVMVKHGIYRPEPEKGPTEDDHTLARMLAPAVKSLSLHERKNEGQLDAAEDDIDEDDLAVLRRKRLAARKTEHKLNRFGGVYDIAASQFVREVSEASQTAHVIVHLNCESRVACQLMHKHMLRVAQRSKSVKFVRIKSTNAIPDYPDDSCPTVLVYYKGEIKAQIVGLDNFGGASKMTPLTLEFRLAELGFLETDIEDPEDYSYASDPVAQIVPKSILQATSTQNASRTRSFSLDSDDFDSD
jgi:hypothetical protein